MLLCRLEAATAAEPQAAGNNSSSSNSTASDIPELWSYAFQPSSAGTFGQRDWGVFYPSCSDPRRSPIDLPSSLVSTASQARYVFYKMFSSSHFLAAVFERTAQEGFFVKISNGDVRLHIEGIEEELTLTTIRVRAPAEHKIDGVTFPMALECDFTMLDRNSLTPWEEEHAGVRLTDLYELDLHGLQTGFGSEPSADPNLAAIFSAMASGVHDGELKISTHLPIQSNRFRRTPSQSAYIYKGTVTRPPCKANLIHIVTQSGHRITGAQMNLIQKTFALAGLTQETGNAKLIGGASAGHVPLIKQVKRIRLFSSPSEPGSTSFVASVPSRVCAGDPCFACGHRVQPRRLRIHLVGCRLASNPRHRDELSRICVPPGPLPLRSSKLPFDNGSRDSGRCHELVELPVRGDADVSWRGRARRAVPLWSAGWVFNLLSRLC